MDVDEKDISKIQVGQKVEITAGALDDQSFTGVVDKININGTTTSGHTSYPVTVKVEGSPEALLPRHERLRQDYRGGGGQRARPAGGGGGAG